MRAELRQRLIVARAVDARTSTYQLPVSAEFRGQHLSVLEGIVVVAIWPAIVAAPRNPREFFRRKYGVLFNGEELRPVLEQHVTPVLNAIQLAVGGVHRESDHVAIPHRVVLS